MISIIQGASPAAWKAAGRRLAYARRPPVAGLRMLKMLATVWYRTEVRHDAKSLIYSL